MKRRARCVKTAYIDEAEVIAMLRWSSSRPGTAIKIHHTDMPDNCEVINIWFEYNLRAFGVLLYHEDFDFVPDGELPPTIAQDFSVLVKVDLAPPQEIPRLQHIGECCRDTLKLSNGEQDDLALKILNIIGASIDDTLTDNDTKQ